jgi:DNA-directed RNA polymerase specialized sigma24 family protein
VTSVRTVGDDEGDRDDASAYEIFASLYPGLRRFAAVVADADMDPDDLVQDALVATLARHDIAELRTPAAYLRQAIVHQVSNRRRRAGRLRRLLPRLLGDTSRTDAYPSDLSMLDELSAIDRALVFLIDVERCTGDEAAAQLGLTAIAARKRVSRARAQLRSSLDSHLTLLAPPPEELS